MRADSAASREDPDRSRMITRTPTLPKPASSELQKSSKISPTSKISDVPSAKSIIRSRLDSVTPQHLRADPNSLKLRTVAKTATVIPRGHITPTSGSPATPTTANSIPNAGPLGEIAHSRSTSVSTGAASGLPKPKVMAGPAKRVEVVSQTVHAEFDVERIIVDQGVMPSSPIRSRTESSASATTASSYTTDPPSIDEITRIASASTSSLASTAESASVSHGSSGSTSSVPRPLRLPQRTITRSFTHEVYMASSSSIASIASTSTTNVGERYQRQRAVSGPRPYRPNVTSPTPSSPPANAGMVTGVSYTSPTTSPTLVPSSPPHSGTFSPLSSPGSPRPRPPHVVGAREPRPKPRTGTGMTYRTSSFGNIQDPRMKNMMLPSTILDRATATTSGSAQPIRI